jgi:hypothetical protein
VHACDHSSSNPAWPGQPARERWFAPADSALEDRHLRVFLRCPFQLFRRESWPRLAESVTSPGGVGSCQEVSGSGLQTCDYNVMIWENVTTTADMSMYLARSGRRPDRSLRPRHGRGDLRSCHSAVADTRPLASGSPRCASAVLTCRTSCAPGTSPAPCLDNREDAGHYTQVTNYLGTRP